MALRSCRITTFSLLLATWGCASTPPSAPVTVVTSVPAAPAGGVPAAPNTTEITARVTDAIVVNSTTLAIEPPQPICVLTLVVIGSDMTAASPLAVGRTVQVLSKDTQLVSLKGGTLTGVVSLRGNASAARLWLTEVTTGSPLTR